MGLGPSKCCKKPANEDEKTPLRGDHELGRDGVKAGFSGRRAGDRDGGDAREGLSLESPVDPDPGVFYAKPASKSSHSTDRSDRTGRSGRKSRRRDRDNSRGRDERRGRAKDDPYAKRHHRRADAEKVGEERILEYHREHPERAPLLGSSSEEEYDEEGHPIPKNWIGVCPSRMQHRVWWWSVTFILCFILCAGVFLGFSHSFAWGASRHASDTPAPRALVPRALAPPVASSASLHSPPTLKPRVVSDGDTTASSVKAQLEETTEELKEEVEALVPEPPVAVASEREAAEETTKHSSQKSGASSKKNGAVSSKKSGSSSTRASTADKEKAEKTEKVEKEPEASSSKKSGSSSSPASTGDKDKAETVSSHSMRHATSHAMSRSKTSRAASKPPPAARRTGQTASAKKRDNTADADKEGAAKLFTISDDYDPFELLAEKSSQKAPRRVGLGAR